MPVQNAWSEILDACLAKQWLTPEASRKAAWLLDHRLHPEQALLGTGLLSLDQFGELVASGVVAPYERGPVDPENIISPRGVIRRLFDEARSRKAHHIRLTEQAPQVVVRFEDHPFEKPVFAFPRRLFSAVIFRLVREAPDRGWSTERHPAGAYEALVLVRIEPAAGRAHPIEWSGHWRDYRTVPRGLLVVMQPDAYVKEKIRRWTPSAETDEGRDVVTFHDPAGAEEEEEISHALLAGLPVIVWTGRDAERSSFVRTAVEAGIPTRVIRGSLTPHGRQWTAYPLPLA